MAVAYLFDHAIEGTVELFAIQQLLVLECYVGLLS